MNREIESFFHEIADLTPTQREQYYSEKNVPPEVRAEVETLVRYDAGSEHFLTQSIALSAEQLLKKNDKEKDHGFGRYRLIRELGRGGMGSVHLAERVDGEVEQRVAIKLIRYSSDKDFRDRFLRERQILAWLNHPGIANLLDAGHSADGQPYLVMDYINGTPIDVYARALDVQEKLMLFIQVCEAVSYAHHNLVVHRDLKPSNILVDAGGQPKLLDFGIATLLENETGAGIMLTREGAGLLTPGYAAPEQLTNGPITTATDVYALGVLLYTLLAGHHPAGPGPHSYADLLKATLEVDPVRLSETTESGKPRREFRGDLDTITAKALKKNPTERYTSARVLADDLRRYLRHEPVSARRDTFRYRTSRFVRRNRMAVTLAAVAIVASIAGLVGTTTQARSARLQRDFALRQLSRAEAINDLNTFLLSDAAPSGKPFTVNDLLGRAEQIIARQQLHSPARHVELLLAIGNQYLSQEEGGRTRPVIEKAYQLSRGISEQATRGKASCAFAAILAFEGELDRAESLFQEGMRELPDEPLYKLDRVVCLLRGGLVARERGAAQEAITRNEDAQRTVEQLPFESELLELTTFAELGSAYRTAGRYREASAAYERASAQMASMGYDNTQSACTLFNNWALVMSRLGQPRESERLYRRAIEISTTGANEEGVTSIILVNYARSLFELGRNKEAATYAERGYTASKKTGVQAMVVGQALRLRSSIYRALGDIGRAEQMIAELELLLKRLYPETHIAFAVLQSERAANLQARGDLQRAMILADKAVAQAETSIKKGGPGADYLPSFLMRQSDIALQLHRPAQAETSARRALEMGQQYAQPGAFSSTIGTAFLALGRALEAQGKVEEARAVFRSAGEHLDKSVGPDYPDTILAHRLAK